MFHLRRERTIKGVTSIEDAYGIVSRPPEAAPPKKLLGWSRSHWAVENGLFGRRDWTLGEDASRVRSGNAAQILAALNNVAIFMLSRVAKRQRLGITDVIRSLQFQIPRAFELLST